MDSEITPEQVPEGSISMDLDLRGCKLEFDTLESFMTRHYMTIVCDLPKGCMETFKHIVLGKIYPCTIFMSRGVVEAPRGVRWIPPRKVKEEFEKCLQSHESDRLSEMVNEFPAQLFLESVSADYSRSALHVAVSESSQPLVDALLNKLKVDGTLSEKVVRDFILKVDKFELSAVDMAAWIGNNKILDHFGRILEFEITDPEVSSSGGTIWFQCLEEKRIKELKEIITCSPDADLNMPDICGRTSLHWAAAQGFVKLVTFLTNQDPPKINLNATYRNICKSWKIKKNENFIADEVDDVTPLHLAVIHNHVKVVEALLQVPSKQGLDINAICKRKVQISDEILDEGIWHWTPFQLAAYIGHDKIMQLLLKDPRLYDPGLKKRKENAPAKHNGIPALHLAASQFHPSTMKALVNYSGMDILVNDRDGNTALHYVTMHAHGQLQVHANLHDYVTVSHFDSKPPKPRKPSDNEIITCMDISMHSVIDVEQKNKNGVAPTLKSSWSENVQKWWLNNIAKEAENKSDLVTAANSVSITAALVATVSFVGPLQPPLGLLDDDNATWLDGYSHVKHTAVVVFLFCNSLSFYFAIAAIVFAMLPSWPIPREWRLQEGRIARRCVQIAVLFLFGSIIFVVCAFSAANISIVPNKRWRYKTIAVISTSLGALICSMILFLSFMRLLAMILPRNEMAKKISNFGIQIILL